MHINDKLKLQEEYKAWRDKLLRTVGHEICKNCNDPRKLKTQLDYDNPLNCGCHCEPVDLILENAEKINMQIEKYSTLHSK